MVDFDAQMDMTQVRLDPVILCEDCMSEMKLVQDNVFRCPKCGQYYYSKK